MIGPMYGWILAGSALGGAGAGALVGTRHAQEQQSWAESILTTDEQLLRSGQVLPAIPEPVAPKDRKDKGIVRCYLTGIVIGGVGAWLITLLVLLGLIEVSGEEATLTERLMSSQLFAFIAGLAGFVFPGIIIGALIYLAEKRAQLRHAAAGFRHGVWQQREAMRDDLATGRLTVPQAVAQLHAGR